MLPALDARALLELGLIVFAGGGAWAAAKRSNAELRRDANGIGRKGNRCRDALVLYLSNPAENRDRALDLLTRD